MRQARMWSAMGIGALGTRRGWDWSDRVLGRAALEGSYVYIGQAVYQRICT
jgi:hypothetical protein